jgi:signal transduction histidine kinase
MHDICESLRACSATKRNPHSASSPFSQGHERTSILLDIPRANAEATRCTPATVDIAAAIMHEICQPLTAIIANAEVAGHYLSADHADLEALRATIQSILCDSIDVAQTIRNASALFRSANTDDSPVDLPSVIKDVLLRLRSKTHQYAINTCLFIDAAVRPVAGDRLQLRQVLTNLMTNAIESMEQNCEWPRDLQIKVSREDKTVVTEIADRGHGIIDCEKIFDAFFSTKKAGMGMGLRISRTIIEAHKGRLWASARRDRGAVLTFTLPLAGELGR